VIALDGQDQPRARWGEPQAIDPGSHLITARAPGRGGFEVTVVVGAEGDRRTIAMPPLPIDGPPSPAVVLVAPASSAGQGTAHEGRRGVAWVSLLAGGAMLATGGVFGVKAIADSRDSRGACPGNPCGVGAYQQNQDARTEARVSDVALAAGALLVGVGLYLFLHDRTSTAHGLTASSRVPRLTAAGAATEGGGVSWSRGAW
jgi:hypothetical protein